MKRLNDLEYLKLNKLQAFWYKLQLFFFAIPGWFVKAGKAIWKLIKNIGIGIKDEAVDIVTTFTKGNWAVKTSFLIFGFGNLFYGQIMRGLLFLKWCSLPICSCPAAACTGWQRASGSRPAPPSVRCRAVSFMTRSLTPIPGLPVMTPLRSCFMVF